MHEKEFGHPDMQQLANILHPVTSQSDTPLDGVAVAKFLAKSPSLHAAEYDALLHYLQTTAGQPWWRHYLHLPHPEAAAVLPFTARQPVQVTVDSDRTFSCHRSHEGNSAIQFYNPHNNRLPCTGFIKKIYQIPLHGVIKTFLAISPHQDLLQSEQEKSPYQQYPHLCTKIVDASASVNFCIIELKDVITHLTVYKQPKGIFGIHKDILVICWALNRGRK
jgi:hypothetical protein